MYEKTISDDRFNKARTNEMMARIFSILRPEDHDLLSFDDVRKVLRPKGEDHQGYRAVPIDNIIGSEGRYRDFSRNYLPKRESSRTRWTSIDGAHQKNIILPAVNLYEIAGYYFVRDGNHRVSVARSLGMEEIDADVIRLDTEIPLKEGITKSALKKQVLEYEKKEFEHTTRFSALFPHMGIEFTEIGRYSELIRHFEAHLRYLKSGDANATFEDAIRSWQRNIYLPISMLIAKERILARFPKRTTADLYIWIIKRGDELQQAQGRDIKIKDVVSDLSKRYGTNKIERAIYTLKKMIRFLKQR